jgi:HAMP domain-containing protein
MPDENPYLKLPKAKRRDAEAEENPYLALPARGAASPSEEPIEGLIVPGEANPSGETISSIVGRAARSHLLNRPAAPKPKPKVDPTKAKGTATILGTAGARLLQDAGYEPQLGLQSNNRFEPIFASDPSRPWLTPAVNGPEALAYFIQHGVWPTDVSGIRRGGQNAAQDLENLVRPIAEPLGRALGYSQYLPFAALNKLTGQNLQAPELGAMALPMLIGSSADQSALGVTLHPEASAGERALAMGEGLLQLGPVAFEPARTGLQALRRVATKGGRLEAALERVAVDAMEFADELPHPMYRPKATPAAPDVPMARAAGTPDYQDLAQSVAKQAETSGREASGVKARAPKPPAPPVDLPGPNGEIGSLAKHKGRSVRWRSVEREFNDDFEGDLYDAMRQPGRDEIRRLQKAFQETTDPAERQRLNEMIGIETRNLQDDTDKFWEWSEMRRNAAIERELDAQAWAAMGRDEVYSPVAVRHLVEQSDEATVLSRIEEKLAPSVQRPEDVFPRYIEAERELSRIVTGSEHQADIRKVIAWVQAMRDVPDEQGGNVRQLVLNALRSRQGRDRSSESLFEALVSLVERKVIAPEDATELLRASNPKDWGGIDVDSAIRDIDNHFKTLPVPRRGSAKGTAAKDGTTFTGQGQVARAARHDAQMELVGKTIQGDRGPEKVLKVSYDPKSQLYTYTVQGAGDARPRVHSDLQWQTRPPKVVGGDVPTGTADPRAPALSPSRSSKEQGSTETIRWNGEDLAVSPAQAQRFKQLSKNSDNILNDLGMEFDAAEKARLRKLANEASRELDEFMKSIGAPEAIVVERGARRLQGGWTRLPVGDLKQLYNDLSILAGKAMKAGQDLVAWSTGMVRRFGEEIRPLLEATWKKAQRAYGAFRDFAMQQHGQAYVGFGPRRAQPAAKSGIDIPAHLKTGEDPVGVQRGARRWFTQLFMREGEAAEHGVKRLGEILDEDLQYSDLDLRSAINEQTRLGRKIDDAVFNGITDDAGNRLSIGIRELVDGMRADGLDPQEWQAYRRALREVELASRGGIDEFKLADSLDFIDRYLTEVDPQLLAKWDAEWQRIADAHLDLFERYGLRAPGWAKGMREENAFYFPLNPVGTDAQTTMRALNPQPGMASPMGRVLPALGGETYTDGFSQMASNIENVIREGEKNARMLPFFDEAAKHEELADIVEEIKPGAGRQKKVSGPTAADVEEAGRILDEDALEDPFAGAGSRLKDMEPFEGQDNVITFYDQGKKRMFKIDPYIWKAIQGTQPQEFNGIQKALRAIANLSRSGTTGRLNPFFAFLFNPMLDMASATIVHGMNPLRFGQGLWHSGLAKLGRESDLYKAATRSNLFFGRGSVRDFEETMRAFDPADPSIMDRALQSRGIRSIRTMGEFYDAAREAVEEATRLGFFAQQRRAALRRGKELGDAEREASQMGADLFNFGEASTLGRTFSGYGVPYANIVSQAMTSASRGFKRSPVKFMARGFMLLTAPALAEYATYKDDPEWQALEDYIKVGAINFRDGIFRGNPHEGDWVSVRIPPELGVLFRGLPLKALQAKDTGDWSRAAIEEMNAIADAYTPSFIPTAVAAGGQAVHYAETGGTWDLRFFRDRRYPVDEDASEETKDKARYQFIKQELDTIFGSMARYGTGQVGYELGYEKKRPSLFQRYRPVPQMKDEKGSGGRKGRGGRKKARGSD